MIDRRGFLKSGFAGIAVLGGMSMLKSEGSQARASIPSGQSLKLGEKTAQPIGHHEFCEANMSECDGSFKAVPRAALTESLWAFIVSTDREINARVKPVSDADQWNGRGEVWSYPDNNMGDCEDYVLEKRRALMSQIHPSNLLITLVRKRNGEGHAVLTVRTDRGDFFLDNTQEPMSVDRSRYTIVKAIDPLLEGRWVTVVGRENFNPQLSP